MFDQVHRVMSSFIEQRDGRHRQRSDRMQADHHEHRQHCPFSGSANPAVAGSGASDDDGLAGAARDQIEERRWIY
jgi:hypothetical protein